jgi:tetratricopeptide (TPR) repeat protein
LCLTAANRLRDAGEIIERAVAECGEDALYLLWLIKAEHDATSGVPDLAARSYHDNDLFALEAASPPLIIHLAGVIASSYNNAGNAAQACQWYGRALEVAERHSMTADILGVSRDLSRCLKKIGNSDGAIARLERAKRLAIATNDLLEIGWIELDRGALLLEDGQLKEAEESAASSLAAFRRVGCHQGIAKARINLANIFLNTERGEQALAECESILSGTATDTRTRAQAVLLQCASLAKLGRWNEVDQASTHCRSASQLDVHERLLAESLSAEAALQRAEFKRATALFGELVKQYVALGLYKEAGRAEAMILQANLKLADDMAACAACERAITHYKTSGADDDVGRLESILTELLDAAISRTLAAFEQDPKGPKVKLAIEWIRTGGRIDRFFELGINRIEIVGRSGDSARATLLANALSELAVSVGRSLDSGKCLHRLGVTLKNCGEPLKAAMYEEKALCLYEHSGEAKWIAAGRMDLALSYRAANQHSRALSLALQALEFFEAAESQEDLLIGYANVGNILKESNRIEEGLQYLSKALDLAERTRNMRGVALVRFNMGGAYFLARDSARAIEAYQHANSAASSCGDQKLAAHARAALDRLSGDRVRSKPDSLSLKALLATSTSKDLQLLLPDASRSEEALKLSLEAGTAALSDSRTNDALKYYGLAERICEHIGDIRTTATTLQSIGLQLTQAATTEPALLYFVRAGGLFGQINQDLQEADCYTNAARAALIQQRYAEARQYVQRAGTIHARLNQPHQLGLDSVIEGELHIAAGNVPAALGAFRRAVDHEVKAGSFIGVALGVAGPALRALRSVSGTAEQEVNEYCSLSGFRLLIAKWRELESISARTTFLRDNCELLLNENFLTMFVGHLAPQAVSKGQLDDAQTLLDVGYSAASLLGSESLYIKIATADADVSARSGEYDRALSLTSDLMWRLERSGNSRQKFEAYLDLAKVVERAGEYRRCIELQDLARRCATDLNDSNAEASALMLSGIAAKNFGRLSDALELYKAALNTARPADAIAASIHSNLGNALEIIGDRQTAIHHYQAALTLTQDRKDPSTSASCHIGWGIALKNLGRYEEAAEHYRRALDLSERYGLHEQRGSASENIRILEFVTKRRTDSTPRQAQSRQGEAVRANELSAIEQKKGNLDGALEHQRRALEIFSEVADARGIATATTNLANLYRAAGDLDAALSWGFRGIAAADHAGIQDLAIESRRTVGHMLLTKDTQKRWPPPGIGATHVHGTDVGGAAQLGPYRPTTPTEYCGQALAYFDQAIQLLDAARHRLNSEADRITLVEKSNDVYQGAVLACMALGDTYQKLKYMEKSRAQALLDLFEASMERKLLGRFLQTAVTDRDHKALGNAEVLDYDHLKGLWSNWVVRADKTDRPTAILMYYFIENVCYVYVIDPLKTRGVTFRTMRLSPEPHQSLDALTVALQGLTDYLNGTMNALSEGELTSTPGDLACLEAGVSVTMRKLYDLLIGPVENDLRAYRRLLIIPHKKLHHVPFHALVDASGRTYVDKGVDVSYMLSLSSLRYCYQSPKVGALEWILCMGDPSGDLPGAATECDDIARLYPHVSGGRPLLHKDATVSAFQTYVGQADIVHLAMHGEYVQRSPMESRLIFSDAPLTARDAYDLDLSRTDTVVLSTCVSAMATVTDSDELIGLLRGFFYAGASTIVASLWPVDSEPTALLMGAFHRRLVAAGPNRDKAECLREAMAEVKGAYPRLIQWAPFCVYGRHD